MSISVCVAYIIILATAMSISTVHCLRQALLNGSKSYGPLILSDSPIVAELLGGIGYGHIVVDHEHSPTNVRSGYNLLQAIQAGQRPENPRTTPIVRVPSPNDPVYMKKVLDSLHLPGGILVPMVDDADTARAVVRSTRYPSMRKKKNLDSSGEITAGGGEDDEEEGIYRGVAAPFVRGSSWGLQMPDYLQLCEEDLLVMVQVESAVGVDAIPDIAAVPGVDAIFLGPFDLSASIGKMGQFQDPEVQELIARAERAVIAYGSSDSRAESSPCLLAGFQSAGRNLKSMFYDHGYSLVCGSVDLALLREGALKDVNEANEALKG